MLANMTSPDDIAAAMAIAMVPSFYALAISEVFLVVVHRAYLTKDAPERGKTLPMVNAVLPLAVGLLMVTSFFVAIMMFA